MGLTLAGTAVAQATAPVLSTWLIEGFGWRTAFVIIAIAALATSGFDSR